MRAQTYYFGDAEEHEPDLPASVLMEHEEALRLQEALRAARDLMTWVLSLPHGIPAQRDTVFAQLRTLEEFHRAHDEAHELGGH